MESHKIPPKAKAGVAFAGVELGDAYILIGSVFVGIGGGQAFGWPAYIFIPFLGYTLNKMYLNWKNGRLPGFLATFLYKRGILGFSRAFDKQEKLFIGNGAVINPDSGIFIDAVTRQSRIREVE